MTAVRVWLCVWVCACVSLPFFLEALKDVVVCSGVCEVCVRACVSLQQSEEKPARYLFVFFVRVTQAVNAILVRSAGGDEAISLSCPSSSPCLRQLPVQPQSDESTLDVNVVSTRDAEVRIDQVNVNVSSMGLVRITSWYPNFNGSHFGLPPSEIHRMTGLPPKMAYSHRPHFQW